MKKQILMLSALLVVGLTSCEKDEKSTSTPVKPKTKIEILTASSWDAHSMRIITTVNDTVVFDSIEAISGKATFLTNKTLIMEMPGEPNDTTTWNIVGDTLHLKGISQYIKELNDKTFIMEYNEESNIPDYGHVEISMQTTLKR